MRLAWVCSRSHGHSARRVRTSSWKRATSPATGAASAGIQSDVRWSGSTARSRSSHATALHGLVGQAEALEDDDLGAVVERRA